MRRTSSSPFVLAAFATFLAQALNAAQPGAAGALPAEHGKDPEFMFVQTAVAGSFEPLGEGRYRLTLRGISPETIFFSDRPKRIAGTVANARFLAGFCFDADDPPNAAVVLSKGTAAQDVLIVELTNPVLAPGTSTLSYNATPLKDGGPVFAFWAGRADTSLPRSFDTVSVFLDDCSDENITCYGTYQCTDEECCQVVCGSIGKHGYCWDWEEAQCEPCHDYTSECYAAACNDTQPYCAKNVCTTFYDGCYTNGG